MASPRGISLRGNESSRSKCRQTLAEKPKRTTSSSKFGAADRVLQRRCPDLLGECQEPFGIPGRLVVASAAEGPLTEPTAGGN
jgi:hypothetical protein